MSRPSRAERLPALVVAALSAAFGVALIQLQAVLGRLLQHDPTTGGSDAVAAMLPIVGTAFFAVATYVAAVVTANLAETVIAGRVREIALLRLLGTGAREQRRTIAADGLHTATAGTVLGGLLATAGIAIGVAVAESSGTIARVEQDYLQTQALLPMTAVVLSSWLASWAGARGVLAVSPIQAVGAAETDGRGASSKRGHTIAAIVFIAVGLAVLAFGVALGLISPLGILIAMLGGMLSFAGVVAGGHLMLPPLLRALGRALGATVAMRLAAENALRHPERSVRSTIGLVIAVTLVTMCVVAVHSVQALIDTARAAEPEYYQGIDAMLAVTVTVLAVLSGFSALIAAVGLVATLSLSVMQRRRELALMRVLGLSGRQIRSMILAESALFTVAAALFGVVLGIFYGWAGAQSLLGSITGGPGLMAPTLPPVLLAIVVAGAIALTVLAALAPFRRMAALSPVDALAYAE